MPHPFFVLCPRFPGNELIRGECLQLTGGDMQPDGFAACQHIHLVRRSAFIQFGARLLAHAAALDNFLDQIAGLTIDATDFCIENHCLPGAGKAESLSQVRIAIADRLPYYPNLDHPAHRYALVYRTDGWWFGEKIAFPDMGWKVHDAKPYRTSSSLPSRLARALVNLAGVNPSQQVINPCCGTGSLMLEAAALGAQVQGSDRNKRMVGMTNRNLAYFHYPFKAVWADARSWDCMGQVLVADLPYNRALISNSDNTAGILAHAVGLAPRAVFVAGEELGDRLLSAGWQIDERCRVPSSSGFARYVYRVHASSLDLPAQDFRD
jgi:predicted RNA methylase